jgi:hypothetical protein
LSTSLTSLLAPAAEYATSVLENIGPMMDYVKEKIVQGINIAVGAFTFFETVLTNLDSVWEMAIAYAEMSMISIKENIMHVLTVEIPAYAAWFRDNFINLIRDAFNGAITIVQNAGAKLGNMIKTVFEFIRSGGAGGVSGLMDNLGKQAAGSLLAGFKSSLTSLPDIAARQLTQREKDLAEKIGAIGGRLGEEFSDKMRERMLGVGDDLSGEISAATSNINLKGRQSVMTGGIAATEGRLLTRGPGTRLPDLVEQILRELKKKPNKEGQQFPFGVNAGDKGLEILRGILDNTGKTVQMEAIA